jgi:hypothetical protein
MTFIFETHEKRLDTGIAEEIIGHTVTDEFNKVLEVQQSNCYTFNM